MTCEQVRRESVAEQYLLGELSETAADEFEQHFFACRSCFEDLKTLEALQQELRHAPRAQDMPAPRSWMMGWRWAWAAVLVAAVALGVWTLRRTPQQRARLPERPAPASSANTLLELARIQPPRYTESRLRGADVQAGRLFRGAMAHYSKGEYEPAIPGLQAAVQADPRDPASRFFLGICLLLTGQGEAGIEALRGCIAIGDSGYLEEARFYLAKALFGEGKVEPARRELEAVIALRGDLEADARQLLARLAGKP